MPFHTWSSESRSQGLYFWAIASEITATRWLLKTLSDEQLLKAPSPMLVRLAGSSMALSDEQPLKARWHDV